MNNAVTDEKQSFMGKWLPHLSVLVAVAIILAILLSMHPWSNNAKITVESYRATATIHIVESEVTTESVQEIAYVSPDRIYLKMINNDITSEMIVIGGVIYSTDPGQMGAYMGMAMAMSVASMAPSQENTQLVLDSLVDLENLPDESIDGIKCRHYRGSIDFGLDVEQQIAELDPEMEGYENAIAKLEGELQMIQQIEISSEIWASKDDGLMRQIVYNMEQTSGDGQVVISQNTLMKYADINVSFEIEAPVDSYGNALEGWYRLN